MNDASLHSVTYREYLMSISKWATVLGLVSSPLLYQMLLKKNEVTLDGGIFKVGLIPQHAECLT